MPTQCNPDALLFAPVEGCSVVASFNGGAITFRRAPEPAPTFLAPARPTALAADFPPCRLPRLPCAARSIQAGSEAPLERIREALI
jgi:hypothetical protein